MVELRPPVPADALVLAAHLRQADVDECRACGQGDLAPAIAASIEASTWAVTALSAGRMVAIFGVAPRGSLLADVGSPWMLGTDLVREESRALMRLAPQYIAAMLRLYPRLENYVHEENTVAKAWLKRMGFALADAKPHGPLGARFHHFTMGF